MKVWSKASHKLATRNSLQRLKHGSLFMEETLVHVFYFFSVQAIHYMVMAMFFALSVQTRLFCNLICIVSQNIHFHPASASDASFSEQF